MEMRKICEECYGFFGETNAFLIVKNGKSLLIDCPDVNLHKLFDEHTLPLPELIVHTQVQEEHCREWVAFPDTPVAVPEACRDLATLSDEFYCDSKTVWPPDREWDSRGEERYGVAGCLTERPPDQPLNVRKTLTPGLSFEWEGYSFMIIALPGSGKYSVGLFWEEMQWLFSGDLVVDGGFLANMYDLERGYGILKGYQQIQESLRCALDLKPEKLLPSTGEVIENPDREINALMQKIDHYLNRKLVKRQDHEPSIQNFKPIREFDRYKQVASGVYQNTNFGNIIAFINLDGEAMIVDPDPCVSWENSHKVIDHDLRMLEKHAGLKVVEFVLITHYHGDHVQFCDILRDCYGAKIVAPPDVAAVMENPEKFSLPCTIEWYDMPVKSVKVDLEIGYEDPFYWDEKKVIPIHTPGHCFAHAGYLIDWPGGLIAVTGDTVQYGNGPIVGSHPVIYNDTAWPGKSTLKTIQRLKKAKPALVLGGHSHSFRDPDGIILDDMEETMKNIQELAAELVADGNLPRAMTPPGLKNLEYC